MIQDQLNELQKRKKIIEIENSITLLSIEHGLIKDNSVIYLTTVFSHTHQCSIELSKSDKTIHIGDYITFQNFSTYTQLMLTIFLVQCKDIFRYSAEYHSCSQTPHFLSSYYTSNTGDREKSSRFQSFTASSGDS